MLNTEDKIKYLSVFLETCLYNLYLHSMQSTKKMEKKSTCLHLLRKRNNKSYRVEWVETVICNVELNGEQQSISKTIDVYLNEECGTFTVSLRGLVLHGRHYERRHTLSFFYTGIIIIAL